MISGDSLNEISSTEIEAMVNEFVLKPFSPHALVQSIIRLLGENPED